MPIRKRLSDPEITLAMLANMSMSEVAAKRYKAAPLAALPDEEADQLAGEFNDIFDKHFDGSLPRTDKLRKMRHADLERMSELVEKLRDLVYAAYYHGNP